MSWLATKEKARTNSDEKGQVIFSKIYFIFLVFFSFCIFELNCFCLWLATEEKARRDSNEKEYNAYSASYSLNVESN